MRYTTLLFVFFLFQSTTSSQNPVQLGTYEGKVYKLTKKQVHKGYGSYIKNLPVKQTVSWKELNIPEMDYSEPFKDVRYSVSFGIIFTNTLTIKEKGCYEIYVNSDDGTKLWLDGTLTLDNGGHHKMTAKTEYLQLEAKTYDLKLWYYQAFPNLYGLQFHIKTHKGNCENTFDTLKEKAKQEAIAKQKRKEIMEKKLGIKTSTPKKEITISKATRKEKIAPLSILFDNNSADISARSEASIQKLASQLKKQQIKKLKLVGSTDDVGSTADNKMLAQKRLDAVFLAIQKYYPVSCVLVNEGEKTTLQDSNEERRKNRAVHIMTAE